MSGFDRETQLSTFDQLTSKVAALVPTGANPGEFNEKVWLNSKVLLHWLMAFTFYYQCVFGSVAPKIDFVKFDFG